MPPRDLCRRQGKGKEDDLTAGWRVRSYYFTLAVHGGHVTHNTLQQVEM